MPYKQIKKLSGQVWNTDDKDFYDKSIVLLEVLPLELTPDYPLALYQTPHGNYIVHGSFIINAPIPEAAGIILTKLTGPILNEDFRLAGTTTMVRDLTDPTGSSDFPLGIDVNGSSIELRPANTAFNNPSRFSFNLIISIG